MKVITRLDMWLKMNKVNELLLLDKSKVLRIICFCPYNHLHAETTLQCLVPEKQNVLVCVEFLEPVVEVTRQIFLR